MDLVDVTVWSHAEVVRRTGFSERKYADGRRIVVHTPKRQGILAAKCSTNVQVLFLCSLCHCLT